MKNIKVKPYAQIEENKRLDYISKFDYILMGSVLAIAIIGLVFLKVLWQICTMTAVKVL